MRKLFCICWMLGWSLSLFAQYCNLNPHVVLHYATLDYKKDSVKRDSLVLKEVVEQADSISLSLAWYGDSYNEQAIRDGENLEYYVYHKSNRLTRRILLDGERENEQARKFLASGTRKLSEQELAEEWKEYSKHFRSEGMIQVPIPAVIQPGAPLPEGHYLYKAGFMKMKGTVKGEYLGMEVIDTPAGRFNCAKIRVESTMKTMGFSEKERTVEWYAQGIGLIQSDTYSKRGKLIESTVLQSVNGLHSKERKPVPGLE